MIAIILTTWTGLAMSRCTQTPGKSKPRWAATKSPAQDDWALCLSCKTKHAISLTKHYNYRLIPNRIFSQQLILVAISLTEWMSRYHLLTHCSLKENQSMANQLILRWMKTEHTARCRGVAGQRISKTVLQDPSPQLAQDPLQITR